MSKRKENSSAIGGIGNFTRNAVESFEENIVNKKDYLEQVRDHKEGYSHK
ncbi:MULTISPECIES: hypothetical protein [Clostridium]|uniref:Uncharacterized protein n=1 Tax=Clostridium cibarium TaxID=2762247 RepID=A0ABR8PT29_9CLOT|nr:MULTISPECIES: hypothetical protein [Clostridium]MBD7911303.1 hypothetical protein [Clostridium cibarium]